MPLKRDVAIRNVDRWLYRELAVQPEARLWTRNALAWRNLERAGAVSIQRAADGRAWSRVFGLVDPSEVGSPDEETD